MSLKTWVVTGNLNPARRIIQMISVWSCDIVLCSSNKVHSCVFIMCNVAEIVTKLITHSFWSIIWLPVSFSTYLASEMVHLIRLEPLYEQDKCICMGGFIMSHSRCVFCGIEWRNCTFCCFKVCGSVCCLMLWSYFSRTLQ